MRTHHALLVALLLAGCGIPKSQYDAAVSDSQKCATDKAAAEKAAKDAQKEIASLQAKVKGLEDSQQTDAQTRAELAELRAQKAAAEARAKLFDDFVKKFQKMIDAGQLNITTRHGQIVLALATDVLFDPGKTALKPEGKKALAEVAAALKGISGRRFQVSGHTDTVPIKTKEFPSNWELSTARAVQVVKLLVAHGVKPEALSAAGYAQFDPAEGNGTKEGRAKNRRIEIVLVPNISELVKMPELHPPVRDKPAPKTETKPPAKPPAHPAHPAPKHPAPKHPAPKHPAPKKK